MNNEQMMGAFERYRWKRRLMRVMRLFMYRLYWVRNVYYIRTRVGAWPWYVTPETRKRREMLNAFKGAVGAKRGKP